MLKVRKRNGNEVEFEGEKIKKAIEKAFIACDHHDPEAVHATYESVKIPLKDGKYVTVGVEEIQDLVEEALMERGHHDVAKAYILYREKHAELRELRPDPYAIADYIHVAKYARYDSDAGRREVYEETVARVEMYHMKRFPGLERDIAKAFDFVRDKKVLPSMRSMQFAGERARQHEASIYNCSFTLVDRPRVFQEIFYLLLTGCGVGYSLHREWVNKLPPIASSHRTVQHFTVGDTIEGWADCIGALINSYVEGFYPEFMYSKIRPEGSPLVTSGGKAPGHIPLRRCVERIRVILEGAAGRNLETLECHDIICHIAEAVLAGGIRRSSLIALFDYEDDLMFRCKEPEYFRYAYGDDPGLNTHRAMSNNSAIILRSWDEDVIRERLNHILATAEKGWAEPGFYFSDNYEHGTNPCGEIGLHPVINGESGFAFCNLTEVNCAAMSNSRDFLDSTIAATFIGTLQASCTHFPYLGSVTEEIARRDALLGVSLTGLQDAPWILNDGDLMRQAAEAAVSWNIQFAKWMKINPAKRVTTVKPSGTASLELGCVGSGIHPHHAKRYFRRVTANPLEPAAQFFREQNPHMVEEKPNGDWCITFPVEAEGVTLDDIHIADFYQDVLRVKRNWVNPGSKEQPYHNVSCTATIGAGEIEWLTNAIFLAREDITAMSFAPKTLDKGIPFCPREGVRDEADMVKWRELIRKYKPVDWSQFTESGVEVPNRGEVIACSGGACEL